MSENYAFFLAQCKRCTGVHFCIDLAGMKLCKACFDTVCHDAETKDQIEEIMVNCGIEKID